MKTIVVIAIIAVAVVGITSSHSTNVMAQQASIPSWVKNNAKWWSEGQVSDSDFVKGIQYMVQNGMITIPTTNVSSNPSNGIPAWVKNDAKWWSEGTVSDDEFVKGMQYLVSAGLIQVNAAQKVNQIANTSSHTTQVLTTKNLNTVISWKNLPLVGQPNIIQLIIYNDTGSGPNLPINTDNVTLVSQILYWYVPHSINFTMVSNGVYEAHYTPTGPGYYAVVINGTVDAIPIYNYHNMQKVEYSGEYQ